MEKFPSLRIQPSPNTTQLTTRASGPFAGEKRREIYCIRRLTKIPLSTKVQSWRRRNLTCDSYKYINALHLLSEAMCMVIKLITKRISLSQVFAVNEGAPHVSLLRLLASQT